MSVVRSIEFNIFRWYRSGWGRYTQADPLAAAFTTSASEFSDELFSLEGSNSLASGDTNVYAYGGDEPTEFVDTFGLARCAYGITSRKFRCRSNDGKDFESIGPDGVGSGAGACANNPSCSDVPDMGPIQPKTYKMNPDDKGRPGWWRLESVPPTPGWRVRTFTGRGGFAIHPGTRTVGCINFDKNNPDVMRRYRRILDMLQRDQPNRLFVTE